MIKGEGISLYSRWEKACVTGLFIVLFLQGCLPANSADVPDKKFDVERVIDGDTIEVTGENRVRLIGIDAPEVMKQDAGKWKFDPETFSIEAKDYMRKYLENRKVTIRFDAEKEDRYGRWLGYVYDEDGTFVNLDLIEKGYAIMQTIPPNVEYYEVFLEAQKKAMAERSGIWYTLKTVYPEQAYKFIGHFCRIKGEIFSSRMDKGKIVLEFKPTGGHNLVAVIFVRNLVFFEKSGISSADGYIGKYVEICGKIEQWDMPVVVLDNPSQIKVLLE